MLIVSLVEYYFLKTLLFFPDLLINIKLARETDLKTNKSALMGRKNVLEENQSMTQENL